MSRIPLRLRLTLAFLALILLFLGVAGTSYAIQRRVADQLQDLRAGGGVDLAAVDLTTLAVELKGEWDPTGRFVASDVELLPGPRRPKLRGPIQAVDPAAGTFTVFGVVIHQEDDTEYVGGRFLVDEWVPGRRVEVSCELEDGRWEASKIRLGDVKAGDKIKGSVTAARLDGDPPHTIELHGLVIEVPRPRRPASGSALRRIQTATNLALALQDCRASAFELVGDEAAATSGAERLRSAADDYARLVELAAPASDEVGGALDRSVQLLAAEEPRLRDHTESLVRLAAEDRKVARAYLGATLLPYLHTEIDPLVHAYLSQAEEDLGDQLRVIGDSTATTTRVALWTGGVAALLALLLGYGVLRSVHRPIDALHRAAVRLGQGHLDTRVELDGNDEFAALARAFNDMAAEIASGTVSVENLEGVLDSMAAALVVLDPGGGIVSVNRAAAGLLGYEREELFGRSFHDVAPEATDVSGRPSLDETPDRAPGGAVSVSETMLLCKDGTELAVSFSCAELRPAGGHLQGYVCVAQDLSERKHIEHQVRRALAEKELLLREVHHRVKNNMQVISSLLAMQSSRAEDPRVAAGFEESQGRIRSMALIHEQLYRSADLSGVDLASYLELLTVQLLESFGRQGSVRVDVRVQDPGLSVDQALACGLLVNELVANALKHAFPAGGGGRIRVTLVEREGGTCELVVADDGRGLQAEEDLLGSRSMGMSLVRTLVAQLEGTFHVQPADGLEVRVVFPAPIAPTAAAVAELAL